MSALLAAALLLAPYQTPDEAKAVSSTFWRIGSPGIYVTAPDSLKPEAVQWQGAAVTSSWAGESDKVRVEVAYASASQFDSVVAGVAAKVGGGNPQAAKISGYEAKVIHAGGNTGLVIKTSTRVWGIAALAKNKPDSQAIADSVVCERTEAPAWRDRELGSTSLQASLPYDTVVSSSAANMRSYEAAWDGIRLTALEPTGTNVDYEGTVRTHVADMQKLAEAQVTSQEMDMQWLGEKGIIYTCNYKIGERPRRLIKIFARPGARTVWMTLDLDPTRADHLAAADRILKTIRTGWTSFEAFKPQSLTKDKITFDGSAALTVEDEGDLRFYNGGSWSVISIDRNAEAVDWATEKVGVVRLLQGISQQAGGTWSKGTGEYIGIGPFLGIAGEGEAKGQGGWVYGTALGLILADRGVFWTYFTTTASYDVMNRVADSVRAAIPAPSGWVSKSVAGMNVLVPADSTEKKNELVNGWEGSANGVQISVHEEKSEGLVPPTDEYFKIIMAGDKAYAPTSIGKAYGHVGEHTAASGKRRSVVSLNVNGRHFFATIDWTPGSKESAQARDAFLASISDGS